MNIKKVTAINGQTFDVDTSSEVCNEFGFNPEDKIIDPFGNRGIVVGVAPMPESSGCIEQGKTILWVALDKFDGKVCFFPNPTHDLQKI